MFILAVLSVGGGGGGGCTIHTNFISSIAPISGAVSLRARPQEQEGAGETENNKKRKNNKDTQCAHLV
jgi:hypothetical protein